MNRIQPIVLLLGTLFLVGCGVDPAEHQKIIDELEQTKAELHAVQQEVLGLEELALIPKLEVIGTTIASGDLDQAGRMLNEVRSAMPRVAERPPFIALSQELEGAREIRANTPEFDMDLSEFWDLTFDDNRARASQLYDRKLVRLKAPISRVLDTWVTLHVGKNNRGDEITMSVFFEDSYEAQIKPLLASIEKGAVVVVQGHFRLDRRWIPSGILLHPETLLPITRENFETLRTIDFQSEELRTAYDWWPLLRGRRMSEIREMLGTPGTTHDNDREWVYFDMAVAPNSRNREWLQVYFRGGVVAGVSSRSLNSVIQD